MIEKFIALQDYVQFKPYPNETYKKTYCLFCGIGNLENSDNLPVFLEMLRQQRRSNMYSRYGVAENNLFEPYTYIHWVIGEKILAVIADRNEAGYENSQFLSDNGGFRETVFKNYILLYFYFLGIFLHTGQLIKECHDIVNKNNAKKHSDIIEKLLALGRMETEKLTREENIDTLFEKYLCSNTLKLQQQLEKIEKEYLPDIIRNKPCDVFISYRRKGGFYPARLLYTLLEIEHRNPFLDLERLKAGRFDEHIYEILEKCDAVLIILTEGCLDRCVDEEDWMRKEIIKALEVKKSRNIKIIPVVIDDFEIPKELPDIINFSKENAVYIKPQSFRGGFADICRFLDET